VDKGIYFEKIVVEESKLIINAKDSKTIALPSFIRTHPDYFLVYGGKYKKIFKFSYDGVLLASFGKKGRGPGEFLSLTNCWIMNDHYLLYDYNGTKMVLYDLEGSLIDEYSVNIGALGTGIEVLSTGEFVGSAKGKKGSLLKITDLEKEEAVYVGEA